MMHRTSNSHYAQHIHPLSGSLLRCDFSTPPRTDTSLPLYNTSSLLAGLTPNALLDRLHLTGQTFLMSLHQVCSASLDRLHLIGRTSTMSLYLHLAEGIEPHLEEIHNITSPFNRTDYASPRFVKHIDFGDSSVNGSITDFICFARFYRTITVIVVAIVLVVVIVVVIEHWSTAQPNDKDACHLVIPSNLQY